MDFAHLPDYQIDQVLPENSGPDSVSQVAAGDRLRLPPMVHLRLAEVVCCEDR